MSPITTRRVRHPLATRRLIVARRESITPSRVRLVLSGDLSHLRSLAADDHIKLIFPERAGAEPALPEAGPDGLRFAPGTPRPPMRDYTPRRIDPARGELEVEFTLHGDGPASAWARTAAVGDPVGQIGPRGSLVIEGVGHWILGGDESALPAIARRLDELEDGQRATVFALAPYPPAEQGLQGHDPVRVRIHWVQPPGGADEDPLLEAIRSLDPLGEDAFVWVGAEAASARRIRAHLRDERGLGSERMRVTGYWRRGVADHHDD